MPKNSLRSCQKASTAYTSPQAARKLTPWQPLWQGCIPATTQLLLWRTVTMDMVVHSISQTLARGTIICQRHRVLKLHASLTPTEDLSPLKKLQRNMPIRWRKQSTSTHLVMLPFSWLKQSKESVAWIHCHKASCNMPFPTLKLLVDFSWVTRCRPASAELAHTTGAVTCKAILQILSRWQSRWEMDSPWPLWPAAKRYPQVWTSWPSRHMVEIHWLWLQDEKCSMLLMTKTCKKTARDAASCLWLALMISSQDMNASAMLEGTDWWWVWRSSRIKSLKFPTTNSSTTSSKRPKTTASFWARAADSAMYSEFSLQCASLSKMWNFQLM